MTTVVYNRHKKQVYDAWLAGTDVRVMVLKVCPAGCLNPDLNTLSQVLAVATAAEADFTGYVRKALTGEATTQDDTNDRANIDSDNVVWATAGGATNNTPAGAVFYEEGGGTDATRILVEVTTTGFGSTTTNGGQLTLAIPDFLRAT